MDVDIRPEDKRKALEKKRKQGGKGIFYNKSKKNH